MFFYNINIIASPSNQFKYVDGGAADSGHYAPIGGVFFNRRLATERPKWLTRALFSFSISFTIHPNAI